MLDADGLGRIVEGALAFTAVCAALTAGGLAARRLWRFVRLSVHAFDTIQRELTPNGGSTTYDAVRRTQRELDDLRVQVAEVENVARLERGVLVASVAEVKGAADQAVRAAGLAVNEAKLGRAVTAESEARSRDNVTQLQASVADLHHAFVQAREADNLRRMAYLQQLAAQGVPLTPVDEPVHTRRADDRADPAGPLHRQREVDTE